MANKDYDTYFNEYLRRTNNASLIGAPRKNLDDKLWHEAHSYARKQLKRFGYSSMEDRRRASTDDRGTHETMDGKEWARHQGLDSFLGGGASGQAASPLSWYTPPPGSSNSEPSEWGSPNGPSQPDDAPPNEEDETDPNELAETDEDNPTDELEDPAESDDSGEAGKDKSSEGPDGSEGSDQDEPKLGEDVDDKKPKVDTDSASGGEAAAKAKKAEEIAEKAAEAVETTAELGAAAPELLIGIVVAIVVFFLVTFLFQTIAVANPGEINMGNNNCAVYEIGTANSDGYYQLPVTEYYNLNINGGSPRDQQWGSKDTIDLIVNVGKQWSEKHPAQKFSVGDINAPSHASHTTGIDVDIYGGNSLMMQDPGGSSNVDYDVALTTELAKMLINTGAIDIIGYSDQSVVDTVNDYISTTGQSGAMANWSGHGDHFHVRVKPGAYVCKSTTTNILPGGVLDVPYQNQFTYGHTGACAITSMAMVVSYYIDPDITYDWVYHHFNSIYYSTAHLNELLSDGGINKTFVRLNVSNTSQAEEALNIAAESITRGDPVVVRLKTPFAEDLHTAVITGFDESGNVYVNDPNDYRGAPPYLSTGDPKGKNNLAPREAFKGAMIYIDYTKG